MSVTFRVYPQSIVVSGKTYEHRELLKSLGGRFNSSSKSWQLPNSAENLTRMQELCAACGGQQLPSIVSAEDDKDDTVAPIVPPIAAENNDGLTIAELLARADASLQEKFPYPIWVVGEVQNLGHKGHIYLQLVEPQDDKQQTLSINAVIWKNFIKIIEAQCGTDFLQDGLRIRCLCDVQLYRERGALSLRIREIDPAFTRGALALARERLLRELRATGKDRINKQLKLARVPQQIGLITAAGSRAYGDFCDQLRALQVPLQVFFRPTPMQGEDVLREVPQAIAELSDCDLIVITRGGGSASDLRWFDSAEIATGIITARVPIVAAIGHHEDLCVAEEISFMRQKTPTAAADYLAHLFSELDELCRALLYDLAVLLQQHWQTAQARYTSISSKLVNAATDWQWRGNRQLQELAVALINAAQEGLRQREGRHDDCAVLLQQQVQCQLHRHTEVVHALEKKLLAVDPQPWLAKGWAQLYAAQERVTSVTQVAAGEAVRAVMVDGQLMLRVVDTTTEQQEEE